ncbi:MAG TPA: MCP four helix bundle domain-containing protein, partial [Burkholderiales bacterium]
MKLSVKLMIAPLVAIGFLIALGAASYSALTLQQEAADKFYQGVFGRYKSVVEIGSVVGDVHAGIYRLLSLSGAADENSMVAAAGEVKWRLEEAKNTLTQLSALGEDPSRRDVMLLTSATEKLAQYAEAVEVAIALGTSNANNGTTAMQSADDAYQAMTADLAALVEAERNKAEELFGVTRAAYRSAWDTMLMLALGAVLASLLAAGLQARAIVARLRRATNSAEALARGDLTSRAKADS